MYTRSPRYVLVLLAVALLPAAACSSDDNDNTGEALLTAPTAAAGRALVTAEPEAVTPGVFGQTSCAVGSPFGFRIGLTVLVPRGFFLRGVRFALFDPFGRRAVPVAISPLGGSLANFPSSGPIPVPGALTMPSASPVAIPGGVRTTFPFFLEFGCGAPRAGTLVATVHMTDEDGDDEWPEVKVRVGR